VGVLPGPIPPGSQASESDGAGEADEQPRAPVLVGDILGEMREYYTWTPDTLLDIARGEDLGLINLMSANQGVDPWLPGKGTRLVLPTAHILPDAPRKGVVINIAELRLYLYAENGNAWSFSIGVGRDGFSTPLGQTKVARKKESPTWYPTAAKRAEDPEVPAVVPPGPDNPMGEHALYLGWPTYAVHGTNQPWAVGRRVTRGCIRLYPEDIAWVFQQIPVGTPVTVVDQPVKLGRKNGEVFIEVHPSLKQVDQIEETGRAEPDPLSDRTDTILAFAGDAIPRLDWEVINQALAERRGYPIQITKPAS
jgi:L,D-transpeptidase ErfK/SrfK